MDPFSFLKLWKSAANTKTHDTSDSEDSELAAGPFFDLDFPDDEDHHHKEEAQLVCIEADNGSEGVEEETESESEGDLNIRVDSSSGSSFERSDPNLPLFPGSDPVDPTNSTKPRYLPISLLRSATRLRILMSGLKKSSGSDPAETPAHPDQNQSEPPQRLEKRRSKLFAVKLKVEEVSIVSSLFTRDSSSRTANGGLSSSSSPAGDEKQRPKDAVQKYFKMVKPLYVRVSNRYVKKPGFSGEITASAAPSPPPEELQEACSETAPEGGEKSGGKKLLGLRVMVGKRLAKSRSAEAGAVHAASPASGRQRDGSLNQQQEWIQGAILHCKKSFNGAVQDECSPAMLRPASDPSQEEEGVGC